MKRDKRQLTVYLTEAQWAWVRSEAFRTGMNSTTVVALLVQKQVEKAEKDAAKAMRDKALQF